MGCGCNAVCSGEAPNEEYIALSQIVGKRIAEEADLPVFLYEVAATRPERKNLATIRKGQFEAWPKKQQEEWEPDFGGRRIHPTGVWSRSARDRRKVSFNLNLNTRCTRLPRISRRLPVKRTEA